MLAETVAVALWTMLPAYIPNNAAVLFGGGPPIDGGRTYDGKRILGDGKTWRGTAAGTIAGVVVAFGLNAVDAAVAGLVGFDLPTFPLLAAVGLAFGAMLGDILASLVKRRSGRARGASFPGLDQLDFVATSLLLAFLLAPAWASDVFSLPVVLAIVVVTPVLHLTTNGIAYLLGLKNEPY
ncbi:CDP-2,3-bis-(O-geranylgeranyl)-sn-glycerol synthase [Halosegnis rubeus]|jgi:CDP-2,3-bis-(O-geranylgeranyl)-sn-glycerol synthase|uniref:CDP-archaeol synthase n=1 Tax=Halosegnis rubeus TaxID=2212850 RepID=A0A5N5UCR3_9EURY|nr:CDP-2,3-bis-(O-geranylgeranyl)-sn-glycerol synthase [Halosegnis rubeus]KAB7515322.1 CDP-2,3-bis-(O-geranylgeranyl)-sn-glycerol synthase [Halosegnis rubeus]